MNKDPQAGAASILRHGIRSTENYQRILKAIPTNVPCGSCNIFCRGFHITLSPSDDPTLETEVGPTGDVILRRNPDQSCYYLVDERCSIYERRPEICRPFDCRSAAICGARSDLVPELNAAVDQWDKARLGRTPEDRRTMAALGALTAAFRAAFEMPTALLAQVSFAESGAPQAIESLTDIMRLTGCTVEQAAEQLKRTLLGGLS